MSCIMTFCKQAKLLMLNEEINLKRPFTEKGRRPVKLIHDNTMPHIARSVNDTSVSLGWEIIEYPAYSPHIVPSDYHLFCSMHKTFEEVRKWVDDFIKSKNESFFYNGIHSLPKKWLKVIDNSDEYFDD